GLHSGRRRANRRGARQRVEARQLASSPRGPSPDRIDNAVMNSINLISAANTDGRIDVGEATGSTEMLMFVYDLAPGQGSSPYHSEHDEEWLLVVEGTVVVRTPDGEHPVERGELVRFPAGPEGAHKVMNRSDAPARTLLFSRRGLGYAVSVYPDSDTIG